MPRPLISARTRARLEVINERAMPDAATISRRGPITGRDAAGGVQRTLSTVATDVPIRVSGVGATPLEQTLGAQYGADVLKRLSIPLRYELRAQDVVTVGTLVYEVLALLSPTSYGTAIQAVARVARGVVGATPTPPPSGDAALDLSQASNSQYIGAI